jgi:hypothetical protein
MSLRKKIKNNETIEFSHPILAVEFFDKKYYKVYLKQPNDNWTQILNDTLDKIDHTKLENFNKANTYYYLKRIEYNDFIELVDNVDRRNKKESSQDSDEKNEESESESSSEESSTDDELIQKTLTRRLTSQTNQDEIDHDHVSDSEMEDVISICRRFRAVYKLITNMAQRIERLENIVLQTK